MNIAPSRPAILRAVRDALIVATALVAIAGASARA